MSPGVEDKRTSLTRHMSRSDAAYFYAGKSHGLLPSSEKPPTKIKKESDPIDRVNHHRSSIEDGIKSINNSCIRRSFYSNSKDPVLSPFARPIIRTVLITGWANAGKASITGCSTIQEVQAFSKPQYQGHA
ncbi:hypothetical protein EDB85DRAFT_1903595 [Lactarius pseudohatsudake]|nr:hypothetical protein EDB85DRAFT_1903595 [Lactarius pseudohatsudake]